MPIDEQDNAIDENGSELAQSLVAWKALDGAAGEGLEPQKQPVGVIRNVQDERAVASKINRDLRPLEVVAERTAGGQQNCRNEESDVAKAAHGQL